MKIYFHTAKAAYCLLSAQHFSPTCGLCTWPHLRTSLSSSPQPTSLSLLYTPNTPPQPPNPCRLYQTGNDDGRPRQRTDQARRQTARFRLLSLPEPTHNRSEHEVVLDSARRQFLLDSVSTCLFLLPKWPLFLRRIRTGQRRWYSNRESCSYVV